MEFGLRYKPSLIREVPITSDGCNSVVTKILKEKLHFSAIFAFSDILAWDAWSTLHKRGFRIPEDYSLIGFDNIQSRLEIPFQLSTISIHKSKMSTTAVECLLSIIKEEKKNLGKHEEIYHHIIKTRLVIGETVNIPKNT